MGNVSIKSALRGQKWVHYKIMSCKIKIFKGGWEKVTGELKGTLSSIKKLPDTFSLPNPSRHFRSGPGFSVLDKNPHPPRYLS
jgi:hypothetical protein